MNSTVAATGSAPASHVARDAIRLIRDEHSRLAAVIHGMLHMARQMAKTKVEPDLKVLRAMLFYISEYPERFHHPKEDQFLFARLRSHTHDFDGALDTLEAQHGQGESLVHKMEHMLIRLEFSGVQAYAPFLQMVEDYAEFYFNHMRIEEETILPGAEKQLDETDWQAVGQAFAANVDPLEKKELKGDFDRLFSLIVNIAPAPIGLGDATA
ncbi:hemerythrin domain-containing protein [Lacisediminimonas sp.]|uniref:hemerythrin domain-containing protein n=1 Tax=Lacisediminimonas sp. TaxID=3060582 RepID=UPI0027263BBA|nr:hemerythrin domain-containing protein [Lacisediminimonas sp.]MDO8299045.1 hemerythrin domain-containing protein [Lacisediminimonas sp.]